MSSKFFRLADSFRLSVIESCVDNSLSAGDLLITEEDDGFL